MKSSRFKKGYKDNASSLHRKVGDILRSSKLFSTYRIYQEYPVSKLNPSYRDNSHRIDWIVLDLKLCIEVHGEQHYHPVSFGGDPTRKNAVFQTGQWRDQKKAEAIVECGFTYIVIPYYDIDNLTDSHIWNLYKEALHDND